MLRKKLCKMLAALMVSTIVLGSNVQVVEATERTNNIETEMAEKKYNWENIKLSKLNTLKLETLQVNLWLKSIKRRYCINVEEINNYDITI